MTASREKKKKIILKVCVLNNREDNYKIKYSVKLLKGLISTIHVESHRICQKLNTNFFLEYAVCMTYQKCLTIIHIFFFKAYSELNLMLQ